MKVLGVFSNCSLAFPEVLRWVGVVGSCEEGWNEHCCTFSPSVGASLSACFHVQKANQKYT